MRVEKLASTVFTSLEDGRGVLLNLSTLLYYSLNRTGAAIWKQIEEAKTVPFDELVKHVCDQYEVSEDDARRYLGEFVERLAQYKMISLV